MDCLDERTRPPAAGSELSGRLGRAPAFERPSTEDAGNQMRLCGSEKPCCQPQREKPGVIAHNEGDGTMVDDDRALMNVGDEKLKPGGQ